MKSQIKLRLCLSDSNHIYGLKGEVEMEDDSRENSNPMTNGGEM